MKTFDIFSTNWTIIPNTSQWNNLSIGSEFVNTHHVASTLTNRESGPNSPIRLVHPLCVVPRHFWPGLPWGPKLVCYSAWISTKIYKLQCKNKFVDFDTTCGKMLVLIRFKTLDFSQKNGDGNAIDIGVRIFKIIRRQLLSIDHRFLHGFDLAMIVWMNNISRRNSLVR